MFSISRQIAQSKLFQRYILTVIVLAGILIGLETSPTIMAKAGTFIHFLDKVIIGIFVLEITIKVMAACPRPQDYFKDGWNIFDFAIVAVCLLPVPTQFVAVFRLLRVLRVLRLITHLPRLQMLIGAIFKSIPSMGYVTMLTALLFYLYAVTGVFLFRENDPLHFGSLWQAFLTLFGVVTLEGWIDVMNIQISGSAAFPEIFAGTAVHSTPHPIFAPFYFISFIIFGTMIVLNLFIGVIVNSMEEMHEEILSQEAKMNKQNLSSTEGQIERVLVQLTEIQTFLQELKNQPARAEEKNKV